MAQSVPIAHAKLSKDEANGGDRRSRPLKKPAALSVDEAGAADKAKKRSAWVDPNLKKQISSPLLSPNTTMDDPFAGMSSSINYQQEIERLKALVPKVDIKKRSPARPKSAGFDFVPPPGSKSKTRLPTTPNTTTTTTTTTTSTTCPTATSTTTAATTTLTTPFHANRKGATSPPRPRPASVTGMSFEAVASRATTPSSVSRMTSPVSTPHSGSPVQSDRSSSNIPAIPEGDVLQLDTQPQRDDSHASNKPVITEEEKARFLQFMRSWTGGWKSWERSDGDGASIESVQSGGSLWAEQLPWTTGTTNRRRSWQGSRQGSLTITLPEPNAMLDLAMRSEPCTPLLAPR